jgi:glyoxylase-like metal-dependent hydrolase (beta-lactamase superfamily II)
MSEDLPLRVVIVPVTAFQQNCSLMWSPVSGLGAVVDPGGDLDRLRQAITANGVTLEKILITHAHLDHAGAAAELAAEFGIPIEGPHPDDQFWIDRIEESGQKYGMPWCKPFTPDRWLEDGDEVTVAGQTFEVYHCPGHTPGHVVFFQRALKLAFVGDVLFRGSIGRTDFPRGNHQDLVDAITGKLWPLGGDVTFVPGHGPTSTFGQERRSNPYVGDQALAR